MDSGFFFSFMPLVVIPFMLLNVAWYVAVLVLPVRIREGSSICPSPGKRVQIGRDGGSENGRSSATDTNTPNT